MKLLLKLYSVLSAQFAVIRLLPVESGFGLCSVCFLLSFLGLPAEVVRPFAVALELLHTFSLVHDDLPSMDNDDVRRGQPTTHKQFGEAAALLAGDALLGRAFGILAEAEIASTENMRGLFKLLSEAVVSLCDGQMLDLHSFGSTAETLPALQRRHTLKTGMLIRASVVGPTFFLPESMSGSALQEPLAQYGAALGLLFQITDDLLDAGVAAERESDREPPSYVSVLGKAEAEKVAHATAQEAKDALATFDSRADMLRELVTFVLGRKV